MILSYEWLWAHHVGENVISEILVKFRCVSLFFDLKGRVQVLERFPYRRDRMLLLRIFEDLSEKYLEVT